MRAKFINESIFEPPSEEEVNRKIIDSIKRGFNSSLGEFRPLKVKPLTPHKTDMPGSDDYLVLYQVNDAIDFIDEYREEGKSLSRLVDLLEDELEDFEALDDEIYEINEIKRIVNIDEENETVTLVMSLTIDPATRELN